MPIRPLLYTMAVPLMLSLLVQSLYNIVDSIFVAKLSETALTAASLTVSATAVAFWGIYYKLQNFLMMPINGLGQAAIPIVGYNYGDKNYQRVQQTWKILLPTGTTIALCGTVIFWCFPGQLLQLFSASQERLTVGSCPFIHLILFFLLYVNTFYYNCILFFILSQRQEHL